MKSVFLVVVLFVSVSCATGYHANSFSGGYTEEKVGDNMYEVEFHGNGYTGRQRVERYLKRRCAELAKENGFSHFIMVNNASEGSERPYNRATIKLINNPGQDMVAYEADLVFKNSED